MEKIATQDNRPSHFPPAFVSPFSINGEEKTLTNMFLQAVHKVLKSSKFTYSAHYQRNVSVESNGMTSCYQMEMRQQTGAGGECAAQGAGVLGEGNLPGKAVAGLDPAGS